MEAIYKECAQLRKKFVQDEINSLPSFCFGYDEGDKYISDREIYERIQRDADKYYQKCLDERSIRVPK